MSDISYSNNIHRLFKESDFKTSSVSLTEDGDSHCIKFDNVLCKGSIMTENGKMIHIETIQLGDE